jgi:hypothetical protein
MYRDWYSVPTGTPRNADTSCTVHRRSAVTACSLLLCVTFDHRFPRLEPNSLSQPFRFLTSHHRHLWRSCNPRCGSARLPLSRAERCRPQPRRSHGGLPATAGQSTLGLRVPTRVRGARTVGPSPSQSRRGTGLGVSNPRRTPARSGGIGGASRSPATARGATRPGCSEVPRGVATQRPERDRSEIPVRSRGCLPCSARDQIWRTSAP